MAARILLSTTSFTVMAAVVALATASVLLVGSIFLAALAQFVAAFWIHRDAHRPR